MSEGFQGEVEEWPGVLRAELLFMGSGNETCTQF